MVDRVGEPRGRKPLGFQSGRLLRLQVLVQHAERSGDYASPDPGDSRNSQMYRPPLSRGTIPTFTVLASSTRARQQPPSGTDLTPGGKNSPKRRRRRRAITGRAVGLRGQRRTKLPAAARPRGHGRLRAVGRGPAHARLGVRLSIRESGQGGDHWCRPGVDRVDDLGAIDALQVEGHVRDAGARSLTAGPVMRPPRARLQLVVAGRRWRWMPGSIGRPAARLGSRQAGRI